MLSLPEMAFRRALPAAQSEPQAGLAAVGIGKSFGKRRVLDGVSLQVGRGEIVGLLGPNGSGKTICFYCMIGLMRPSNGEIYLDGTRVTELAMDRRARRGLGYLPQEPSIFGGLTAAENINLVLERIEPDPDLRQHALDELICTFEIQGLRDVEGRCLASGERRLCEIARAVAAEPEILLLDEPLVGQGPRMVNLLKGLMRHLKTRNIGMLVTDHNVHDLLEVVDRAYLICAGRLLMEGSPDELVANSDARRLYFGQDFHL